MVTLGEARRAGLQREEVGRRQEEEVSGQEAERERDQAGSRILRSAAGIIPLRSLSPLGQWGGGVGGWHGRRWEAGLL